VSRNTASRWNIVTTSRQWCLGFNRISRKISRRRWISEGENWQREETSSYPPCSSTRSAVRCFVTSIFNGVVFLLISFRRSRITDSVLDSEIIGHPLYVATSYRWTWSIDAVNAHGHVAQVADPVVSVASAINSCMWLRHPASALNLAFAKSISRCLSTVSRAANTRLGIASNTELTSLKDYLLHCCVDGTDGARHWAHVIFFLMHFDIDIPATSCQPC